MCYLYIIFCGKLVKKEILKICHTEVVLSHRSLNERREKNGIREEMFTNFEFKKRPVQNRFQVWGKGLSPAKILWKLVVLCDLFPIMWLLPFHTHEKCCFVPHTHINKLFSSLSFIGQKTDTFHAVNRKRLNFFTCAYCPRILS